MAICFGIATVGHAGYIVEMLAHAGDHSSWIATAVDQRLLQEPPLDCAIVMAGTNDALNSQVWINLAKEENFPELKRTTLENYENNVREMLQKLIDNQVETVIAEILPCIDEAVWGRHPTLPQAPNLIVVEYNEALHRAAEATDPPTTIVPTHALFLPHANSGVDGWLLPDGVHPNAEGAWQLALIYSDYFEIPLMEIKRLGLFGDSIHAGINLWTKDHPATRIRELFNPLTAAGWTLYQ